MQQYLRSRSDSQKAISSQTVRHALNNYTLCLKMPKMCVDQMLWNFKKMRLSLVIRNKRLMEKNFTFKKIVIINYKIWTCRDLGKVNLGHYFPSWSLRTRF